MGEDKAYDSADHVAALRELAVTPHVAQNDMNSASAIDRRTTRHTGYNLSQTRRKMIECIFGWSKQFGTMRKTRHRGLDRVGHDFMINLIAYNLVRIPKRAAA